MKDMKMLNTMDFSKGALMLFYVLYFGNIIPILCVDNVDGVNKSGHYAVQEMFEAAFQGECREDSPCQQLCFDLYDGTFECGCKDGYTLFADGYTCIENNEYDRIWNLNLSLTSKSSSASESSNRHIFYYSVGTPNQRQTRDNDKYIPSRETPDPRSRTLSQSDSGSSTNQASEASEEQPSDYDSDSRENDDQLYRPEIEFPRDEDLLQKVPERRHHRKTSTTSAWKQVAIPESDNSEELSSTNSMSDIPLPSELDLINTITMTTAPSTNNNEAVMMDTISCDNLHCRNGGWCEGLLDNERARCRCPIGWSGIACEKEEAIHYPRLRSQSYLALRMVTNEPVLESMQIELEFRPELYEGVLLYIGRGGYPSREDVFCSLILRNGILEMRYFGGIHVGVIRSDQPVTLNTWNRAIVYFDEQKTWLQLNGGLRPGKQSKGVYPRLARNNTVYLGGYPNISRSAYASETPSGLQGCVRHFAINGHTYNFRSTTSEDILDGADIEECRPGVCNTVSCMNGGQCIAVNPNWGTCLCPLGFGGDQCEEIVEITVPSFDGTAHLQFPGLASSSLTYTEILLVLMPKASDGALLYNGYRINGTGDFLSLSLESGHVILRFDLGTGVNTIRSLKPITMYNWHTVYVTRTGRLGILRIDDEPQQEVVSPGGYSQLSLPLNLYIGGVPSPKELASGAEVNNSFVGCVQKLVINGKPVKLVEQALSGVNINNCEHPCAEKPCDNKGTCIPNMDSYSCLCATGYTGSHCKTEIVDMVSKPMFTGNSYLHYVNENLLNRLRGQSLQMSFSFRALSPFGLMLWAGSKEVNTASDYIGIRLHDGHLRMDYNLGSGPVSLFFNHSRVDDGQWHELKVVRFKQRGSLTIDSSRTVTAVSPGPLKELNIPNELYLGGMPEGGRTNTSVFQNGFVGCLSNFTLDNGYHVQFLTMAVTGINIQPCV